MPNFNSASPYAQTDIVNGYLDVLNFIDIPAYSDDVQYTLTTKYLHRPDLLAYDVYGNTQLWWVFAARNKEIIKDSIFDFVPGQTIFLPKTATIKAVVGV
jgi:hypothetical protein